MACARDFATPSAVVGSAAAPVCSAFVSGQPSRLRCSSTAYRQLLDHRYRKVRRALDVARRDNREPLCMKRLLHCLGCCGHKFPGLGRPKSVALQEFRPDAKSLDYMSESEGGSFHRVASVPSGNNVIQQRQQRLRWCDASQGTFRFVTTAAVGDTTAA